MTARLAYASAVGRALFELAIFDLMQRTRGFDPTMTRLARTPTARRPDPGCEPAVCDAVLLATCLYWKKVLCLQRSYCTARLLRAAGVPARLVIGVRPSPLLAHAWVEVGDRVVNDSPAYRQRLRVLHTV